MAKSSKSSDTKITRIKATDSGADKKLAKANAVKLAKSATPAAAAKKTAANTEANDTASRRRRGALGAIGGYFKGSWHELRQVRWPDRRSTWAMTGALLVFTAFFVVIILLLDNIFKYLFNLLLGL